jgi:hypothetical protein
MYVRQATPRALAAAGGAALIWLAIGADATRPWMWGLAGLFAVFGYVNRQFHAVPGVILDPISRAMDVACCRRSDAWLPFGSSGVSRRLLVTSRRSQIRVASRRVAVRARY